MIRPMIRRAIALSLPATLVVGLASAQFYFRSYPGPVDAEPTAEFQFVRIEYANLPWVRRGRPH